MAFELLSGGTLVPTADGSFSTFKEAIKSTETKELTEQAIAELINSEHGYVLPDIVAQIVMTLDDAEAGHCVVEKRKRPDMPPVPILYTHANFQLYLANNCIAINADEPSEINPDEEVPVSAELALQTAAVYARSIEVIKGAVSFMKKRRSGDLGLRYPSSFMHTYWSPEFRSGNVSFPFRAAATVALKAAKVDIDIKTRPPYPPHIAGLMNPLPRLSGNHQQGFDSLYQILTKYSNEKMHKKRP